MKKNLRTYKRLWSILATFAVVTTSTLAASPNPGPETALQEMREAFRKNDSRTLRNTLPRLQGHLLEPLAAYWELRVRLDSASSGEIRAFLQRWAGSYYEDRLRNDWLQQLGRRADWDTFRAEYPLYRMQDDREVQCHAVTAGAKNAEPQTVARWWLEQKEADTGCAGAVKALWERQQIGNDTVWQRARMGMETGRLRMVSQAVAILEPEHVTAVDDLFNQPAKYLDEKLTAVRPRTKEWVTLALVRLAVKDHEAAAEQMQKLRWRTQLNPEEKSWVWGVIGRQAAQKNPASANGYFAQAQDRYLNDELLTWKTRAALRANDWRQVQQAIAHMREPLQRDPTWTYWQARALLALQGPDHDAQARALLERIATGHGFYEQLALEALGQATVVSPSPAPLTPTEKEAARQHPGLQRALWAIQNGLRAEGVKEWNYTTNLHQKGGMADRELLAAADLACQHQVWDRCINTSERTKNEIDARQRFPMPHRDLVLKRARDIGLDPAYVYGLIRQESRFVVDAKSGVGAAGLMQIMPTTAQWTAKRMGMAYKPQHIAERDTNIALGTAYLKLVLDDFEGSLAMAAAAYNAGPSRPRNWRNGPVLEAAAWIENIPFAETRDYVKRVLSNTIHYAALISGQPQRISSRLAAIGPRLSTQPIDNDLP